jgi:hypothetical protein
VTGGRGAGEREAPGARVAVAVGVAGGEGEGAREARALRLALRLARRECVTERVCVGVRRGEGLPLGVAGKEP